MIAAFDIGGTLMEYRGMPNVWIDYYDSAFKHIRSSLLPFLTDEQLNAGCEILKGYNPRIKYREAEYPAEQIFAEIAALWNTDIPAEKLAKVFFENMQLTAYTYPETIAFMERLRAAGARTAALTDVATGMPDELHKKYIENLLPFIDYYVSSVSCRYRKPNIKGLYDIAVHFGVTADEIVFIGDEQKDIKVAKDFGCTAVLIDRYGKGNDYGQDMTVSNLDEYFDYLVKSGFLS